MDGVKTVFPDIISSRLEDLYGAPLPDEEFPLYREAIRKAAERLLELTGEDDQEEAKALVEELESLGERVRRVCMRFAYLHGLQDGHALRQALEKKPG